MPSFNVSFSPGLVRLSGEIDMQVAPDVVAAGMAVFAERDDLLIDFDAVTFFDSTAIAALIELRNAAMARQATLALTNVPARVQQILEITGLTDAFDIRTVFDIRPLDGEATGA
jgi:anti-sigma B factor antagonist